MANGRLRTMLAGLQLDLSPRRDRRGANPHFDAATAPRLKAASKWLDFLAECVSDLRRTGRRRRSSWKVAQRIEPCEAKMLLSGMAPYAMMDMYDNV